MFLKKVFIYGVVTIFVFGSIGAKKLAGQVKIGYVDSQRILSTYVPAIDAQRELDARNEEWDEELQQMNDELVALQEELEQRSLLLSEAKKREKAQEIESMVLAIQTFQDGKWGNRGQYFLFRDTLMKPIYDSINQAIQTIADDEDYDLILDSAGGDILYAKTDYDVTELVLEELESGTSEDQMYYDEDY